MGCKREAPFSRRLTNETEVQVIGKEDKYMSVCRTCYFKPEIQSPHKIAQIKNQNKRPLSEIQEEIEDSEKTATPTKRKLFNIHSDPLA